jgi:hypothetical protein
MKKQLLIFTLLSTSISSFGMENKILHQMHKEQTIAVHLRKSSTEILKLSAQEPFHGETFSECIDANLRSGKKALIARTESHWDSAGCFGEKREKPIIYYFDGYALAEWLQLHLPTHPHTGDQLEIVEYFVYDPVKEVAGFAFLCTQEDLHADNEKGKILRAQLNIKEKPKVTPTKRTSRVTTSAFAAAAFNEEDALIPLERIRHTIHARRRASSSSTTGFHATINSQLPLGNG